MFGLDFMGGLLQEPNTLVFFALFFLFIVLAYKVVKILMRAAMIAAAAALFPVVANVFLGLPIEITLENIIRFAMMGAEVYFTYHLLTSIGKIAELISKPFGGRGEKRVEKIIIVKDKDKDGKKEG